MMSARGAAWPAIVGVAALLVVACGEQSRATLTACPAGSGARRYGTVDPAAAKRLQGTLDRVRREQRIPGAAAAVVIDGCLWVGASGLADVRTGAPVRPATLFAIASVTKPLIAALVLALADDGVLGLDDELSRWVPGFPGSGRITLRQLLSHTSGNGDYVSDGRFLAAQRRRGAAAAWMPGQLLRYVPEPLAAPGERWSYSNANFLLLGLVIERATHTPLARELHRRLLPRATFDRILFQPQERPRGPVAVGYMNRDADPEPEPTQNNPLVPSVSEATSAWGSGNLLASAGDLARAGDRIFAGDLLSAGARRAMTRWVRAVFKPPEYGLGLGRDRLAGQEVWGHSGDIAGFHADLWFLPRSKVTVAALVNYQGGPDDPAKRRLAERLVDAVRALRP
jgi:D-alanyl-D-alanine carboxypeptidase